MLDLGETPAENQPGQTLNKNNFYTTNMIKISVETVTQGNDT